MHKHAKERAWLARHPRFHLHFTPTYSSWPNQVERWFALITNQAIRRGSFDSVTDLQRKITEFVDHYNKHPRPFMWTATAESILAKLERLRRVVNGTSHQQEPGGRRQRGTGRDPAGCNWPLALARMRTIGRQVEQVVQQIDARGAQAECQEASRPCNRPAGRAMSCASSAGRKTSRFLTQ